MRDILFRGKTQVPCGRWVYGSLITDYPCCKNEVDETVMFLYIYDGKLTEPKRVPVVPDTIGQYTGLTDKNGKKIFEGDIVAFGTIRAYEVKYDNGSFCMEGTAIPIRHITKFEVIGNIHDNPELLKGGGKI